MTLSKELTAVANVTGTLIANAGRYEEKKLNEFLDQAHSIVGNEPPKVDMATLSRVKGQDPHPYRQAIEAAYEAKSGGKAMTKHVWRKWRTLALAGANGLTLNQIVETAIDLKRMEHPDRETIEVTIPDSLASFHRTATPVLVALKLMDPPKKRGAKTPEGGTEPAKQHPVVVAVKDAVKHDDTECLDAIAAVLKEYGYEVE